MSEPPSAQERLIREVGLTVRDRRVLDVLLEVPRDRFVPAELRAYAYENEPLPIGSGQTISQPLIVGMMTEALALTGTERVLEIGTGSGYQAAVLARLAREVVTTEVHDALRTRAEATLRDLGVTNVTCLAADHGNHELGASHLGPYDAIIVTAAAPAVPRSLLAQLRPGGRIVIPVGSRHAQDLLVVTRSEDGSTTTTQSLGGCQFVPLVGPEGFAEA
ncbi:MAG: protein-L-isoaspartate(D-aspartate) O-methyltransferase [Dehalococcoidia bacterium]|nr:protein-L-isoaspartate(D-aspartate) O-methyltransferase [Dehalococcoidia bacterium]